ncbi:MAG: hypothetical protein R6U61_08590 [Thermoplasmata archaeon]
MKRLSEEALNIIEEGKEQIEKDEGQTLLQVKEELESYTKYIHEKAENREEHISLEEYGKREGLR